MNPPAYTAAEWICRLSLDPHPEGGHYREVYRAGESIPEAGLPERFPGSRSIMTSIYYLLESGQYSTFHRIKSDELWHFYAGDGLTVYVLDVDGVQRLELGPDPDAGQVMFAWVPAGRWFAARCEVDGGYALAGCTVAPGFDVEDFDMAARADLLQAFPGQAELIRQLTPDD